MNTSADPKALAYAIRLKRGAASLGVLLVLLFAAAIHASAQGCTQCLDSTRATPAPVQAAYRHAILLLGGTGATLFIAGLLFLRRNP